MTTPLDAGDMTRHSATQSNSSDFVVNARHVVKRFYDKKTKQTVVALNDFSLTVTRGSVTALIGPDGAGKTTFVRLLCGLLAPDEGTIEVLGHDVVATPSYVQAHIAYMPQKFGLYEDLTVMENLNVYADLHRVEEPYRSERAMKLFEMTGLAPFTNRLAGKLSGGMKQKLALVCTLIRIPDLLILDEPSVGVDPLSRRELWAIIMEMVKTDRLTVLVNTGYIEEAVHCDTVHMIHEGKLLITGTPDEVFNSKHGQWFMLAPPASKSQRRVSDELHIEVKELVRKFGDFTAVDTVSFQVHKGEIFGLLGPNGAGKTTTFRMLCGLLPPTSGYLSVAGYNLRTDNAQARRSIGYVAQKFSLYGTLTVHENLEFFGGIYGLTKKASKQRIEEVLAQFNLKDKEYAVAATLPLGYKQRLSMAAALLHKPEILFLDEPTSGIDPTARRRLWSQITDLANRGTTIVITTHFMEEAEYCDRIMIQDQGHMIAIGTPEEIRAQGGHATTMNEAFIHIVEAQRSAARQQAARPAGASEVADAAKADVTTRGGDA